MRGLCHSQTHTAGGILEDADSELTLVVEGYMYFDGDNLMRQRTYSVFNQVCCG